MLLVILYDSRKEDTKRQSLVINIDHVIAMHYTENDTPLEDRLGVSEFDGKWVDAFGYEQTLDDAELVITCGDEHAYPFSKLEARVIFSDLLNTMRLGRNLCIIDLDARFEQVAKRRKDEASARETLEKLRAEDEREVE